MSCRIFTSLVVFFWQLNNLPGAFLMNSMSSCLFGLLPYRDHLFCVSHWLVCLYAPCCDIWFFDHTSYHRISFFTAWGIFWAPVTWRAIWARASAPGRLTQAGQVKKRTSCDAAPWGPSSPWISLSFHHRVKNIWIFLWSTFRIYSWKDLKRPELHQGSPIKLQYCFPL